MTPEEQAQYKTLQEEQQTLLKERMAAAESSGNMGEFMRLKDHLMKAEGKSQAQIRLSHMVARSEQRKRRARQTADAAGDDEGQALIKEISRWSEPPVSGGVASAEAPPPAEAPAAEEGGREDVLRRVAKGTGYGRIGMTATGAEAGRADIRQRTGFVRGMHRALTGLGIDMSPRRLANLSPERFNAIAAQMEMTPAEVSTFRGAQRVAKWSTQPLPGVVGQPARQAPGAAPAAPAASAAPAAPAEAAAQAGAGQQTGMAAANRRVSEQARAAGRKPSTTITYGGRTLRWGGPGTEATIAPEGELPQEAAATAEPPASAQVEQKWDPKNFDVNDPAALAARVQAMRAKRTAAPVTPPQAVATEPEAPSGFTRGRAAPATPPALPVAPPTPQESAAATPPPPPVQVAAQTATTGEGLSQSRYAGATTPPPAVPQEIAAAETRGGGGQTPSYLLPSASDKLPVSRPRVASLPPHAASPQFIRPTATPDYLLPSASDKLPVSKPRAAGAA